MIYSLIISTHSYRVIILVINLSLRFISPLGRFPKDFLRKRTPCTVVLYATPFHSLSIYPLHLSLSLISPSTFLSLSLLLSSIILFGVSNGRFRPCYIQHTRLNPIRYIHSLRQISGPLNAIYTIIKQNLGPLYLIRAYYRFGWFSPIYY